MFATLRDVQPAEQCDAVVEVLAVRPHLYGVRELRRFLRTLFAGGTRMPPVRIWATICSVEGWTPSPAG